MTMHDNVDKADESPPVCKLKKVKKVLGVLHVIGIALFIIGSAYNAVSIANQNPAYRHISGFIVLFSIILILPYIFMTPILTANIGIMHTRVLDQMYSMVVDKENPEQRETPKWKFWAGGAVTGVYLLILIIVPISMQAPSFVRYVMDVPPLIVGHSLVLEGIPERVRERNILIVDGVEVRFNQRNFRGPREGYHYTVIVAPFSMTVLDIFDESGVSRRRPIRGR